tara:strand:+ start:135 stop:923 length:789 start_codon:yes stop_codon:yes gene_type:complete
MKYIFVTVCYNFEKWIGKCIKSAINQKYKNWEMYLIDDFSSDNSVSVAEMAAGDDPRIKIIKNTQNMCGVYNKTVNFVNHAKPNDEDVIVTLDGDDYLLHGNVLDLLNEIYNNDYWLTYGGHTNTSQYKFADDYYTPVDWSKSLRNQRFCLSHLKSHKFFLVKNIKNKDLCYRNGNMFKYADDVITYVPMAEMSGQKHSFYIKDKVYFYNMHDNCDFQDKVRSEHINKIIREDLSYRPAYKQKSKNDLKNSICDWKPYKLIK